MSAVGIHYDSLMDDAVTDSLSLHENKFKSVASQVKLMAKSEGIILRDMHECLLDQNSIVCDGIVSRKKHSKPHIISVYNSNLETQMGFFLKINREMTEEMTVEVPVHDIKGGKLMDESLLR